MSSYAIGPDTTPSINHDAASMTSPVLDPSRPIVVSPSSGSGRHTYSSMEHNNKANDLRERNHSNPVAPAAGGRGTGSTYSYEELGTGLTCPTCQGTGKIPRGQEDDLVALIPYNDKRLKPRRTGLYVFLSFFVCIALAGTLCAFLIPRSIDVVHDNVTTLHVDLNVSDDRCFLALMLTYNVTNNNFVPVMTNSIGVQISVLFHGKVIVNKSFGQNKLVPIRTKEQIMIKPVNMTLTNDDFPITYCSPAPTHDSFMFMRFQSTFNFTLMTRTDQQIVTHYFRVNCNPDQALDEDGNPILEVISREEYTEILL